MDKIRQKKVFYNETIINELMIRHKFSKSGVQKAIRGERTSDTAIKIQEEYNTLLKASNKTINQQVKQL
ncbi:hypothetical protein [Flavobacterium psychrophilum]|nr:hypothetical protein [Flavobacterium psychrophilum]MCB6089166.1 hypothetical protein [Flavobacterium psychrophilum]SNA72156.1 hypothetical protein FI070_170037 [Flavobacterium psychrophilum]SNA72861.1 hypothetical protein FI146_200032 [Flavobacterium psychrophilum]SNA77601.1 hypothetical protein DK095_460162 [Flavobacterium psychrophilum]